MSQTWKAKYNEILGRFGMAQLYIRDQQEWLSAALNGRAKFLFLVRGPYQDDCRMVYRMPGGAVVQADDGGGLNSWKSLADMLAFYEGLSDRPHNLEVRERIAAVMVGDASVAAVSGLMSGVLAVPRG